MQKQFLKMLDVFKSGHVSFSMRTVVNPTQTDMEAMARDLFDDGNDDDTREDILDAVAAPIPPGEESEEFLWSHVTVAVATAELVAGIRAKSDEEKAQIRGRFARIFALLDAAKEALARVQAEAPAPGVETVMTEAEAKDHGVFTETALTAVELDGEGPHGHH
jgi:hypothetical protein